MKISKVIAAHPRLYASIGFGICVGILAPIFGLSAPVSRIIIGYDFGALIYIAWAWRVMATSNQHDMRRRAVAQDEGKFVVLALVVVALAVSMTAIFVDLATARALTGAPKYQRLAFALLTILASWIFTHVVFALHYAHEYYLALQRGKPGGLEFHPVETEPDYLDFVYFSFVVAATAQTADVTTCSRNMRRILLCHSTLAFFFNTALLALTVNIAANFL